MDRSDEVADDDLDLDDLDPAEPENWKRLREYASRQEKAAKEAEGVKRENAFLRAGIDLSTRLGSAFAQTYVGKLDDIEAIRADAKDFDPRILGTTETESAPATQEGQAAPVPETTGTQERGALADGALPAGAVTSNVRQESIDQARKVIDQGAQWEVGAGELVAMRARAVLDGQMEPLDPRTGTRR